MKPPFTLEQFLEVFKSYNQAVFPIQVVFFFGKCYCNFFGDKTQFKI